MGELERLHQARLERERKAREEREAPDPTEWAPKGWRTDWERGDHTVRAKEVRTDRGLRYQSLALVEPGVIAGIEARARGDLVREMDRHGVTVDERALRVEWTLHVVGYGYEMPEGFVHPDAPDNVKAEGRRRWKRVVEIASDSLDKVLFLSVWRRKPRPMESLERPVEVRELPAPEGDEDDVVDAEIVEED